MPANLTLQYKESEARFRRAADHAEKMDALREMIALLPKHKGTEKLHADLKHRLAKLEEEGEHVARSVHRGPEPGRVKREGAGQWVMLGPPNAGKSMLLAALTHAHPEVADYPFTTRAPQPGMMTWENVQVQLVDTPAVAPGHVESYLPALAGGADGLLLVVDVTSDGIGQAVRECVEVLQRGHVWPSPRPFPFDASPLLAQRPCYLVGNKCDLDEEGVFAELARDAAGRDLAFVAVSALRGQGLDPLRAALWRDLHCIRVHTKEPGKKPDLGKPFVLPEHATVHDLARMVHRDMAERLKFARVWGTAKFEGQQVDRHHELFDHDVVELHA
ncbi:MAG TPA: GTPase [Anaeromyxobacter sp.]|nr:GTPase [Anaeromyxobacter sp.]